MKRRITMTVEITEHEDGTVDLRILDRNGELITRKDRRSTWDTSTEIGATAFEMAEEVSE